MKDLQSANLGSSIHKTKFVYQSGPKERWSYYLFFVGQIGIYAMVSGYLMLFFTDFVFIPAAIVSVMIFLSKGWDAVNDPLFGIIADRSQFKKGKFIPWVKISTLFLPLATILLFVLRPEMALWLKITLASGGYLLWDTLYTIGDVSIYSFSTLMTDNLEERTRIISFGRIPSAVMAIAFAVALPLLLERIGYVIPAILVAIVGYAFMLPFCLMGKERVTAKSAVAPGKIGFRQIFTYFKQNKYLVIIFGVFILSGSISVSLGNYIAKYNFGSLDYVSYLIMASIIPIFLVYALVPMLIKKYEKIKLLLFMFVANMALGVVIFLVGYDNFLLYALLSAVRTFFAMFSMLMMFMFTPDCVEYGHFKTGTRQQGITFAVQTFTAKFTAAISAALSGVVLTIIHYDASLDIQPAILPDQLWAFSFWVPLAGSLIALPLLFLYKLKDKDVQIMAECNSGKITVEDANAALSRPY